MSTQKKNSKKIVIVVVSVVIVLIVSALIALTCVASNHNKQVDQAAAECEQALSEVSIDFSQPVDNNKAYANVVELSIMQNEGNLNEKSLTYFDGSKAKYNEVKDKADTLMNQYKDYFTQNHENIFKGNDIDVNSASKEELTVALDSLTKLSKEAEETLSSTIWNDDEAWSMLWGDTKDEAKENYANFKSKLDNKINEIKTRLDQINAEEAQAAQAAQTSNTANNNNGNNNSGRSYSGSGSGYSGGGSSGGGGGSPTHDDRSLWEQYQSYVAFSRSIGKTPLSFEEWLKLRG